MKRWSAHKLGIMVMAVLLLSACGGGSQPATEDVPTGSDTQATTDVAPAEEMPTTAVENNEDTSIWDATNFTSKLEQLQSYVVTFQYKNTSGDTQSPESYTWSQRVDRGNNMIDTTVSSVVSGETMPNNIRYVTVGDTNYLVFDETQQCTIINSADMQSEAASPESIMFANLTDMQAEGAGPDIDGRATDAYSGNFQQGVISLQMTAYIDREYGVPLQWDTRGTTDDNGMAVPYEWSYRVTEINTVQPATIPAACEQLSSGSTWPLPADAQVTMQTAEMFVFTTNESMDAMVEFYGTEMIALGYTAGTEGMNSPEMSMLTFTKDAQTVTVVMSAQSGALNVIIQTVAN